MLSSESLNKVIFPIKGMHCLSCASNIERFLGHLTGVVKVSVNFGDSQVNVEYDSSKVTVDEIKKSLLKLGYKIKENNWSKAKTFWVEHGFFIIMIITGLLVIGSWLLMNINSDIANILAICAVIFGGYSVFSGAVRILLVFDLNVEVLITVAAVASVWVGAYREAAMVIFIMLAGETLEKAAVRKTRKAITKLMEVVPDKALLKKGVLEVEVAVENLHIDNIVIIKPGERIPVDGVVIKGEGTVNESMLTGESMPVSKNINDRVYTGTLNESGSFEVKATKVGENTQLAHIKKLVLEAETEKAPIQRLADKFVRYFIPVVVLIVIIVYITTLNIPKVITILVAACPCAMVLAAPTAVVAGLGNAARKGILIKGGQYMETFGHLDTLLMDKTGTLTQGKISVTGIKSLGSCSNREVVKFAAIAEKRSEHPIAKSILDYAKKEQIPALNPDVFESFKGMGVSIKVSDDGNQKEITVGNRLLMSKKNVVISSDSENIIEKWEERGETVLLIAVDTELVGLIGLADILRFDVVNVINNIRKFGVKRIALLTGDNSRTAKYIAEQAGIDEWYSELLPEDKINKLKEIKETGSKTGMIGDGINDAPALATADIGIAMGTIGSDVAIEAADVSLMKDDLSMVPVAMKLSRRVWNTIMQNFGFSILYNIVMISLVGLFVHEHSGITWGAIFHQLSSLIVIGNSLRLLRG